MNIIFKSQRDEYNEKYHLQVKCNNLRTLVKWFFANSRLLLVELQ